MAFARQDAKQRGDELLFVIRPTAHCMRSRNDFESVHMNLENVLEIGHDGGISMIGGCAYLSMLETSTLAIVGNCVNMRIATNSIQENRARVFRNPNEL
jgi:hypothetical protein